MCRQKINYDLGNLLQISKFGPELGLSAQFLGEKRETGKPIVEFQQQTVRLANILLRLGSSIREQNRRTVTRNEGKCGALVQGMWKKNVLHSDLIHLFPVG